MKIAQKKQNIKTATAGFAVLLVSTCPNKFGKKATTYRYRVMASVKLKNINFITFYGKSVLWSTSKVDEIEMQRICTYKKPTFCFSNYSICLTRVWFLRYIVITL